MGRYYNFIYLLLIFSVILLFHSVSGEIPFLQLVQNRGTPALDWVSTGLVCCALQKGGEILGTTKKSSGTASGWRFGETFCSCNSN